MSTEPLILLEQYCRHEEIEIAFVQALTERGLIQVVVQEQHSYIPAEHLPRLEQLARLHYELEINLEGLEAISHLLERMEQLQAEMRGLRERLRVYEGE